MDNETDGGPSTAKRKVMLAVIVGACLVLAVVATAALVAVDGEKDASDGQLALLRARMNPEPAAAEGAVLVSRQESPGDSESDGPTIEWEYAYSGSPDEFAAHYRVVLTTTGWHEMPAGNLPGQIANFEAPNGDSRVVLVLFAPGADPTYRLVALG